MAQAKSKQQDQPTPRRSFAALQKEADAARPDVEPFLMDFGDGKDTGHGKGVIHFKDPGDLGLQTMMKFSRIEELTTAHGLAAFSECMSEEDFDRLYALDPPMRHVNALMEAVADHYGVPSEGESGASLG